MSLTTRDVVIQVYTHTSTCTLHTILGAWCRQRAGLGAWGGALHVNISGDRERMRDVYLSSTHICSHVTFVSLINALPLPLIYPVYNTHSSFSCLCGSSPLLQLLPDCLLFSLGSPTLPESSLPPPPPLTLLLCPLCEPFFGWGDLGFSSFLKRKKRNSSLKWWSSHTVNRRGRMRKKGRGRINSKFMNSCRVTQAK